MCARGWSLALVRELAAVRSIHKAEELKALSSRVRRLHQQWSRLPKAAIPESDLPEWCRPPL